MNPKIVELRHKLHSIAELSNKEYQTSNLICQFFDLLGPDETISIAKTGIAFVFNGSGKGPSLMFRAELDALPVAETMQAHYASQQHGIAHACGHDGHMSILAGLAEKISVHRPKNGRVILLFQPAEELEQGARDVINDEAFSKIEPDYLFALHNIPGVEKHTVVLKRGSFASASKGMTVKFFGKTSHAAEPENGNNPAPAIAEIINNIQELHNDSRLFSSTAFITIIHIQLGDIAFGTSPGYAELRCTLRAFENSDMEVLTQAAETIVAQAALRHQLKVDIQYLEVFPATENHDTCVDVLERVTQELNLKTLYPETPYRWSEDFAYYSQCYQTYLFGLGAGVNHPPLHHENYDFPDDIIDTGVAVFYKIYEENCL